MTKIEDIHALANHAAAQWPEIVGQPVLVMHRENSVFRVETSNGPHALRLHRNLLASPEPTFTLGPPIGPIPGT